MALFSKADKQRIEAAIRDAEAKSAGELVVAVTPRSHDEPAVRAIFAQLTAVGLALVGSHLWPQIAAAWLILATLPLAAVIYALLSLPPLARLFLRPAVAERAVREGALVAFAEHGLHRTRERTGLLIFVSELERRVEILADEGLHRAIGEDGWRQYVSEITTAIRGGEPARGVAQVIDSIGALLALHFPRRADDQNELPNAVVEEPHE